MIEYQGPIIVIAGPTACGKSNIALKLAKDINGEIINADSRQIYKEIYIGTAKPSKEEMLNIPHHLYGHVSVKESYNIYRYQKDVKSILDSIPSKKTPILVGGTGLYIDSVVFNYKLEENDIDIQERKRLENLTVDELKEIVDEKLFKNLNESDKKNPMRLIRLIEKGNISKRKNKTLNHLYFVIDIPREELNKRIGKRTELMFKKGLLEENHMVREKSLEKYTALKTIGYQEFDGYFENKKTLDEVKVDIVTNTKRYAKRQRTWFRKHKSAVWTNNYDLILEESLKFIKTS